MIALRSGYAAQMENRKLTISAALKMIVAIPSVLVYSMCSPRERPCR